LKVNRSRCRRHSTDMSTGSGPLFGLGSPLGLDGHRDRQVVFLDGGPISFASIGVSRSAPLGPRRLRVMAVAMSSPSSVLGGVPARRYGPRDARRGNAARRSPLKASAPPTPAATPRRSWARRSRGAATASYGRRSSAAPWATTRTALDRIDEIVPPGSDVGTLDQAYLPPAFKRSDLRRRPVEERAAV